MLCLLFTMKNWMILHRIKLKGHLCRRKHMLRGEACLNGAALWCVGRGPSSGSASPSDAGHLTTNRVWRSRAVPDQAISGITLETKSTEERWPSSLTWAKVPLRPPPWDGEDTFWQVRAADVVALKTAIMAITVTRVMTRRRDNTFLAQTYWRSPHAVAHGRHYAHTAGWLKICARTPAHSHIRPATRAVCTH